MRSSTQAFARRVLACVLAAGWLGICGSGQAAAAPVLIKVVMVSRHGVRSPTLTIQALQAVTGRVWPAWTVEPGELTPQGERDLALMGGFLRDAYRAKGALPTGRCPAQGDVQVWADGVDHRTRRSGDILAGALAPGCGVVSAHGPDGQVDPLFDGFAACPLQVDQAVAAIRDRAGGDLVGPASGAIEAARVVLGPEACKAVGAACLTAPTVLVPGKTEPRLKGPLAIAASFGENLLLEYADGQSADRVGWGGAPATTIAAIMPAHERFADLIWRTPYMADRNGFVMARTVLDLLQGRAPRDPRAPPLSGSARITMIAGHDTNLANLAGVFGLDWRLPDEPDSTAPDTTLAFELWRDPATGAKTVRVVVYSQSLEQLRGAAPLDAAHPAGVTPVALPACEAGACDIDGLERRVLARLPPQCFETPVPARADAGLADRTGE